MSSLDCSKAFFPYKYRLSQRACIPLYVHHYGTVLLYIGRYFLFFYNYGLARWKQRLERTISVRPESSSCFVVACVFLIFISISDVRTIWYTNISLWGHTGHLTTFIMCCNYFHFRRWRRDPDREHGTLFQLSVFVSINFSIWQSNYSGSNLQSNQDLLLINVL